MKDTDWLSVGRAGGGGVGDWWKEGGGGGDKEGGAEGTAYLERCLQVLGEAGCRGPVLLAALDLLQQPLPGQEGGSGDPRSPGLASRPTGSQQHPGAASALREATIHHPTPPPAMTHQGLCSKHLTPQHTHTGHTAYSSGFRLGVRSFQTACPDPMGVLTKGSHTTLWLLHGSTYQHHGLRCTGLPQKLQAA